MKKFFLVLASTATLSGACISLGAPAQASPLNGGNSSGYPGWGQHGGGYHGCGPACTPPGFAGRPIGHRPHWDHGGGYGGNSWGGYQVFARPVYAARYEDCEWVRVRTPYGSRWRAVCE